MIYSVFQSTYDVYHAYLYECTCCLHGFSIHAHCVFCVLCVCACNITWSIVLIFISKQVRRDVHIYIYIHTYMHTYIHVHMYRQCNAHIYICMHIYIYIHLYIHIHIYTYTYVHIYTYIKIYVYMYIYLYQCMLE